MQQQETSLAVAYEWDTDTVAGIMSMTGKGRLFGSPLNPAVRGAASSWFTYLKTAKRRVKDLLIS